LDRDPHLVLARRGIGDLFVLEVLGRTEGVEADRVHG